MLQLAGRQAAPLAALLGETDVLRGAPVDLGLRLSALSGRRGPHEVRQAALDRARIEASRLGKASGPGTGMGAERLSVGAMAALAYPDRIGLRRSGDAPRFLLSGGKGARIDAGDPLAGQPLIVATDTDGDPREARVRQAAALTEAELRGLYADRIAWSEICLWDRREGRVVARRQERLGALVLAERPAEEAPPEAVAQAMCAGVRQLGLRLTGAAARLCDRAELVRASGAALPPMDEPSLLATLEDWLAPHLAGVRTAEDWRRFDILPALRARLGWAGAEAVERAAPAQFTTPLGRKVAIEYEAGAPGIAVRLQEMFGLDRHPLVAGQPLRITLLSPAGRPVQVTTDLPGFWAGAYADVRRDMRGRYPRHPWPEDPTLAAPTLRAKPRPG